MHRPKDRPDPAHAHRPSFPASPCIARCTLDDDNRCLGCGRTLDQIARWALMSAAEQRAVLDELAAKGKSAATSG